MSRETQTQTQTQTQTYIRTGAAVTAALLVLLPAVARADTFDSALAATGYAVPTVCSSVAALADGAHLAYDEPTPALWRWLGWGSGGVSVALGVYLVGWGEAPTPGAVSIGIGAAAVVLATLAPAPERLGRVAVVPWVGGGAAGASLILALEQAMDDRLELHPLASRFLGLGPDEVLEAASGAGHAPTGRLYALSSYENRVYQIELEDGEPIVGKFYRPGRWSRDEILDEHDFLLDLEEADVPVAAPLDLTPGQTLGEIAGIHFALFPRVAGRTPQELDDEQVRTLGRTLARLHGTGARHDAPHRTTMTPETWGTKNLAWLLEHDAIPAEARDAYAATVGALLGRIAPLFADVPAHRIHGDCHLGNLLWTRSGPVFVDLDDCVLGPAVQDVWLLVPSYDAEGQRQRRLLVDAYAEIRPFDPAWLRLVEPLRALRFIHYATWIARRWSDAIFPRTFPHFGTVRYWQDEIQGLREQIARIDEERQVISLDLPSPPYEEIGRSALGRAILARRVPGRGAPALLFGAIHGDEPLGAEILARLPDVLAARPPDREVWLLPVANPDGFVAGTKDNARGVDLNRNFPAANWSREHPDGFEPGPSPASEPETRALAAFIARVRPAVIVSIHSPFRTVNFDGPARDLAERMGAANGYGASDDIGYPCPGSFGSLFGREHGLPVITLEIPEIPFEQAWKENLEAILIPLFGLTP